MRQPTGDPRTEYDIGCAIGHTTDLCRALGLLAIIDDWRDRSCQLTRIGTATALETLARYGHRPRERW